MKKSRYVASILRGASIIVLALPAAGCDSKEQTVGEKDVKIYSSVEACASEVDPAACEKARNDALAEHREKAPRYQTAEECRAAGSANCEEVRTSSGGSFFMPALMGFMMGRMMGGGGSGFYGRSTPVYYDRDGYATTTDRRLGVPATSSPGSGVTSVRTPVTAGGDVGTRMASVSRGGFGSTASRFGSGS